MGEGLPFGKCYGSWSRHHRKQANALIYRESDAALFLLTVDLIYGSVKSEQLSSKYLSALGPTSQLLGATVHGAIVSVLHRKMI